MQKDLDHKQSTLNESNFKEWPVWSMDDSHDFYYPVQNFKELPEDASNLRIKALFWAPNGFCFKGCIIGLFDIFCIHLFSKQQEFLFNAYALSWSQQQFQKLKKTLPPNTFKSIHDMFPLKYETQIDIPGWKNISGEFDLFNIKQPDVIW